MARYTELFSEYLEGGGQLPANFASIEGFTSLFKAHYCDHEIGFETETLFALKLEEYAEIYVPIYVQRLTDLASAITQARTPIKTYYEHYETIYNAGEQNTSVTELPFDASTAEPSSTTHADDYRNDDSRTTNKTESGVNVTEAYAVIDKLNESVRPLIMKLLKEFEPLFMKVY